VCGTNISNNIRDGTDNSNIAVLLANNSRLVVLNAENCGNSKDYIIFSEIRGEPPRVGIWQLVNASAREDCVFICPRNWLF
jgi:hypothetical protein